MTCMRVGRKRVVGEVVACLTLAMGLKEMVVEVALVPP